MFTRWTLSQLSHHLLSPPPLLHSLPLPSPLLPFLSPFESQPYCVGQAGLTVEAIIFLTAGVMGTAATTSGPPHLAYNDVF